MDRIRSAVCVFSLAILLTGPVAADVLLMDSTQAANAVETPRNGMNMDSVRARFGNPVKEYPPVSTEGNPLHPPITRWDYNGYSVFFENDLVLHSVVSHPVSN